MIMCGQFHQLCAWAGVSEFTGLPLSALELFRAFGVTTGTMYIANGFLLWFSFLTTRVLSLGMCAAVSANDFYAEYSAGRFQSLAPALRYVIVPSLLFLWTLSTFWFSKIHRGFVKALAGGGRSEKLD